MHPVTTVLVVAPDAAERAHLLTLLVRRGFVVYGADSFTAALTLFAREPCRLVIASARLGKREGIDLFKALRVTLPDVLIILVGRLSVKSLLAALHGGAVDYLARPVEDADLAEAIARVEQRIAMIEEHATRERARLEQEMTLSLLSQMQTENLGMISRLSANIAHEINNPLTPIIGMSELLLDELPQDSPHRAYLDTITTAARRIAAVVQSLMGFTRPASKLESFDLRTVIREILLIIEQRLREQMIACEVTLPQQPVMITASIAHIKQALHILVDNAREAMPTGGKLRLDVGLRSELAPSNRQVASVVVSDTGPAIAQWHTPYIFVPFYNHSLQGTRVGPGLAIVHQIVQTYGGSINVTSTEGQGNMFQITLPIDS